MSKARSETVTTTEETVDVFALPVHPWAARFPMRSDEDLQTMAASIQANGLRIPVVIGKAVIADGMPEQLCLVDGRNRLAACKIAGISPSHIMLNGEDQDAFIVDANLERRDLSKGQKAMLFAIRFPEAPKGGRGKKVPESGGFSRQRVGCARTVIEHAPELIDLVIDGSMGLDAALDEATRRKQIGMTEELRAAENRKNHEREFAALKATDPDLADQVQEDRISIDDAKAAAIDRRERNKHEAQSYASSLQKVFDAAGSVSHARIQRVADLYRSNRDAFTLFDLPSEIDKTMEILKAIREATK